LALVVAIAGPAESHPLHTSLAELTYDSAQREVNISLRVFVDDFSRASAAYARAKRRMTQASSRAQSSELPALVYVRSAFAMTDRSGRRLPLAYCGGKRVADLIWLCFHTSAPGGLAGLRVSNGILFDLYSDQINIVQAAYRGKKISLLFTHGDGFKRLD
jgi:hypothetical protein